MVSFDPCVVLLSSGELRLILVFLELLTVYSFNGSFIVVSFAVEIFLKKDVYSIMGCSVRPFTEIKIVRIKQK